ncbi:MAG TPA: hypothetical protein VLB68_29580, partial [Pyrinomonadaceae bacterium]|nr:hypothetical protein [Pyrinomonadaceae bacterium]
QCIEAIGTVQNYDRHAFPKLELYSAVTHWLNSERFLPLIALTYSTRQGDFKFHSFGSCGPATSRFALLKR